MLGVIPLLFNIDNKNKIINISLSFASGVMISASIFDLIPEAFNYFNLTYNYFVSICLLLIIFIIGLLISTYINKLIDINNNLYKIGISTMIIIIIHNLPEGIITFLTTSFNVKLGLKLFIAILLHNIPEGISIAIPIYYSTKNIKKALLYTFIASIAEPLGAILSFLFLKDYVNSFILGILSSLIAGIMINISIYELLPETLKYKNKKISLIFFIFGLIFMYISIKLIV